MIRPAAPSDLPLLLSWQRAFYAEDRITAHKETERAFAQLLGDASIGGAIISDDAGYAVWTLGFSLEAGGRDAFIDELYVLPAARSKGVGRKLIAGAIEAAEKAGARAIHLEMAEPDPNKHRFYESCGFKQRPHPLMSRR